VAAEVGEVRDEFCPGDHSIRVGDGEGGMKVVGIAQRITRRATSVGGIVLVEGEQELSLILEMVYDAMNLPFRRETVGSLSRAGYKAGTQTAIEAFAAEAERVYGATSTPLDEETLELAGREGQQYLVEPT
jgi:lipoate-protein ligase A